MARPSRLRKNERRYGRRRKDRDLIKSVEEVFDSFTLGHMRRLEWRGVIWELKGVISSGKEARVYWARSRNGEDLAVKIYLSATAEFRHGIRKYILGDPRFENIPKNNFRKLIYEWTRKEFRNLKRMYRAGVRVPKPIAFSGNVLVMDFIGEKGYRAPLLIEVVDELDNKEIEDIYKEIAYQLQKIVCGARLVHADLSEFNIMVWKGVPWIIDVSQAVEHTHPLAGEFLERDIANLTRFFSRYTDLDLADEMEAVRGCLLHE